VQLEEYIEHCLKVKGINNLFRIHFGKFVLKLTFPLVPVVSLMSRSVTYTAAETFALWQIPWLSL